MRTFIVSLALLAAAPVAAQERTALQDLAAQAPRGALSAAPAPAAPAAAPVTVQESWLELDRCWTRDTDPAADRLGLPREFCLKKAGLRVDARDKDIFSDKTSMLVETGDGLLRPHISGFARAGREWTVTGDLFSAPDARHKCGTLNAAFAAIYLVSSRQGELRAAEPEIRGFLADISPLCEKPAKSVEFLYRPAGRALPASLPPAEAKNYIDSGRPAVIDVRTPQEYAAGRLEKAALNLDYYAPDFRDSLNKLDKSAPYLVYCRSGKRSAAALSIMKELGFADARDIAGGILAWTEAGYPVVK